MSNIFDLFGAVNNAPSHQYKRGAAESMINPLKLRNFTDNKNMTLKHSMASIGSKPRGLSIRPQSDPNICNANSNQTTDKITSSKPTLKPIGTNSNTLVNTSRNNEQKVAKLQIIRKKQRKGLSPVSKTPHAKVSTPKQNDEFQFKKPKTPDPINKKMMVYPEPEKLINDNDQEEIDRISIEKIYFHETFNNVIVSRKHITPFEDEGFISEPELLNVPPLLPVKIVYARSDSDDEISLTAPELPILSDDDDNF